MISCSSQCSILLFFKILNVMLYYPVSVMAHTKDPFLVIIKYCPWGCGTEFPLSLCELSLTLFPTPYNRNKYVLSVALTEAEALRVMETYKPRYQGTDL